jgi:hypothetical protein
MSFKTKYPEFAPIEQHIRRAHAERSVAIAAAIANALVAVLGLFRGKSRPAKAAPAGARKPLVVKARLTTART